MENRDAIVRKLNALKAKFEHGATNEAEADAAMRKYNELMQRYNLTETDLNIRESGIKAGQFYSEYSKGTKNMPAMGWMINPIARVTQTRGIMAEDKSAVFLGTLADVQYAEFLYRLIDSSLIREWKSFRYTNLEYKLLKDAGTHGRTIRKAFENGFLQRMTAKLLEMVPNDTGTGTDLVVLKNQLIQQAMEDIGMQTERKNAISRYQDNEAAEAGADAADKVRLRQEAEQQKYLEAK